jgi:hypothetical protein
MPSQCSKCSYTIAVQPGEKRPPWCPRCGADLKETAAAPIRPPATPASPLNIQANGAFAETKTATRLNDKPLLDAAPALAPHDSIEDTPGEVFACKWLWPVVAFLCMIVCLGIVGIAVSQLIHPLARKPTQTGIYGVIVLFGIGGLVSAFICFRLVSQKYAVFADHLVEWQCFKPTTYRWEHIREVFQVVHPAWTKFRVWTRSGRVLTITGETKNHKRLGELISGHVAARLLPEAMEELEAGRDVHLGPLSVSSGGITIDGQLEPWHRIGVFSFGLNPNPKRDTSLVSNMIHVRIGSFLIELSDIPNFRLLEEIASRVFPACVA